MHYTTTPNKTSQVNYITQPLSIKSNHLIPTKSNFYEDFQNPPITVLDIHIINVEKIQFTVQCCVFDQYMLKLHSQFFLAFNSF